MHSEISEDTSYLKITQVVFSLETTLLQPEHGFLLNVAYYTEMMQYIVAWGVGGARPSFKSLFTQSN